MVIFNFRSDRVIEISKAFEYEDFTAFDRKRFPKARLAPLLLCAATDFVISALPATRFFLVLQPAWNPLLCHRVQHP